MDQKWTEKALKKPKKGPKMANWKSEPSWSDLTPSLKFKFKSQQQKSRPGANGWPISAASYLTRNRHLITSLSKRIPFGFRKPRKMTEKTGIFRQYTTLKSNANESSLLGAKRAKILRENGAKPAAKRPNKSAAAAAEEHRKYKILIF